jgi:hypothetical protein
MKAIVAILLATGVVVNASTNEPPKPAPALFRLSPEAQRLEKSPHFRTVVNEFEGRMRNFVILDTAEKGAPRVEIALSRTVLKDGSVTYHVSAVVGASTAAGAEISESEPLEFLLDGHRYTCAPLDEPHAKSSVTSPFERTSIYECGELLVRAIAKSQRRQLRVPTKAGPAVKTLDHVAAKRAEIFVRAFVEFPAR